MKHNEVCEQFQRLIIDNELPKTEMALYGVRCPYCGKSDRIQKLETPGELEYELLSDDLKAYAETWEYLTRDCDSLGTCRFCYNPLKIYPQKGLASPMFE